MGHSSTNFNTRNASEELTWYYVQPGFKLITPIKFFLAVLAFVLILVLLALLNPQLVLDSYWTLLIVPLDALFVGWMLLTLQPHRQIYYRLDSEGVSSEFRSTASPLAGLVSFLLGTFCTMIGLKKSLYLNNHSSRSRVLDWGGNCFCSKFSEYEKDCASGRTSRSANALDECRELQSCTHSSENLYR